MNNYVFAADIGGTTVKLGLFTESGELLHIWEIPTRTEDNGVNVLPDIAAAYKAEMAEKGISSEQIIGVGIGVPGPVTDDGIVNKCVNLGWGVFNVGETFENLTGFKTYVNNDANVAALGEMWQGGGKGFGNQVMVTLGTGVGGGIIMGGRILSGFNGAAGEVGHITMYENETAVCGCGKKGCLEQYASANGLLRLTKDYLAEHQEEETVLRSFEKLGAKDICLSAYDGDAVALKMIETSMTILGRGLAQIACVVNPEAFVIGGGLSKSADLLIDPMEASFRKHVFHASRDTKIVFAKLGNEAGIYGCAKMVLG